MWFIGVEVAQETTAPPPNKNPGSTPDVQIYFLKKPNQFNQRAQPVQQKFMLYAAMYSK